MTKPPLDELDLDAVFAASAEGAGAAPPLRFKGDDYELPAGLPADVLQPLLPLLDPLWTALGPMLDDKGGDPIEGVVALLANNLPAELVAALDESGRRLFDGLEPVDADDSQWAKFKRGRPTITHYIGLVRGLAKRYGVSLGELLASAPSSPAAGETSNGTSPATTAASTRPRSGSGRARRAG